MAENYRLKQTCNNMDVHVRAHKLTFEINLNVLLEDICLKNNCWYVAIERDCVNFLYTKSENPVCIYLFVNSLFSKSAILADVVTFNIKDLI